MTEAGETITFLDGTFEEALTLTREAREYLALQESADRAKLAPEACLVTSCEAMRMTARLAEVMAWLLVQKVVCAGEMTRDQAAADCQRLAGQGVCSEADSTAADYLPPRLAQLLMASHTLYTRVARLDNMIGELEKA